MSGDPAKAASGVGAMAALLMATLALTGCERRRQPLDPERGPAAAEVATRLPVAVEVPANAAGGTALRVAKATLNAFPSPLLVSAELTPAHERHAFIAPRVAGRVVHVEVDEGSPVRAGALLVMLESEEVASARAAYRKARVDAEEARRGPLRFDQPSGRPTAARTKRLSELADAEVQRARQRLLDYGVAPDQRSEDRPDHPGHVRLRSPINGVVVKRAAVVGQVVEEGEPLLEVANLDVLTVRALLPQEALPHVREGEVLAVRLSEGATTTLFARVTAIARDPDPGQPGATLTATLQNTAHVRPGAALLEIPAAGAPEEAVAIPAAAVQQFSGSSFVFVPVGGRRYQLRRIEPGRQQEGLVEVRAGIAAGEDVVVEGSAALRELARSRTAAADMPPQGNRR